MKFFATLTAISALATSALAQLTINSPAAIIQCQPVQLTFSGGEAPYYLAVIPGGQVSAAPLRDFGQVSSSPYTWNANLQAGTSITLRLSDSAGLFAYSSPITIQAGSSDSCLSQTAITQSGASTVASTPSSSGAASAATTTGGLSSTVTGTVTSAASVTTTFSSSAMSSSTNVVSSATGAVSSRVSSASNALSSALSSVQSQVASATSTGAASPTGIAGAGAVFVGALGAMAALL